MHRLGLRSQLPDSPRRAGLGAREAGQACSFTLSAHAGRQARCSRHAGCTNRPSQGPGPPGGTFPSTRAAPGPLSSRDGGEVWAGPGSHVSAGFGGSRAPRELACGA